MRRDTLKHQWQTYESASFTGWDFSYIQDEWENEALPWEYEAIVKMHLSSKLELLDMGTGGGEFLLSLHHPYERISVTEGWPPNIELLKKKLVPLGMKLAAIGEDDIIEFADNQFDIILNRHESFKVDEVKRVLKPSGLFITQQVGGQNGRRLSQKLIPNFQPKYESLTLENTVHSLKSANFEIIRAEECFPWQKFFSMKALIYYAKVIEWEFPSFNVKEHFPQLLEAYEELQQNGYILNQEHRFLVVARNKVESS